VGTPAPDGPAPSTDCLDTAIDEQLLASESGTESDISTLPPPERARIAAALAALELSDRPAEIRDGLVRSLRTGSPIPAEMMLPIQVGEVDLPTCA
jgi:hypothetical protein